MFRPLGPYPYIIENGYCHHNIDLYNGCTHACLYCFSHEAFGVRRIDFSRNVCPIEIKSFDSNDGETVFLSWLTDPYPNNLDTKHTRSSIIKLKRKGLHIRLLTKNPISRDFDLFEHGDFFGVTLTGNDDLSPGAPKEKARLSILHEAHEARLSTWVSVEPVANTRKIIKMIHEKFS